MKWLRLGALVGALVLGACGTTSNAIKPTGNTEFELRQWLVTQFPSAEIGPVICPRTLKATGDLACDVVINGEEVVFDVQVRSEAEGGYSVRGKPRRPVISSGGIVEAIKGALPPGFTGVATVDCGPNEVFVADVGTKIECSVADQTRSRTFEIEITDEDGHLSARSLPIGPKDFVRDITRGVKAAVPKATVTEVTCLPLTPGPGEDSRHRCALRVDNQEMSYLATARGNDYGLTAERALIDLEAIGDTVGARMTEQLGETYTAACGSGARVVDFGAAVECSFSAPSRSGRARVQFFADGRYSIFILG